MIRAALRSVGWVVSELIPAQAVRVAMNRDFHRVVAERDVAQHHAEVLRDALVQVEEETAVWEPHAPDGDCCTFHQPADFGEAEEEVAEPVVLPGWLSPESEAVLFGSSDSPASQVAEVCRAHRSETCVSCDEFNDDLWVHPQDLEDVAAEPVRCAAAASVGGELFLCELPRNHPTAHYNRHYRTRWLGPDAGKAAVDELFGFDTDSPASPRAGDAPTPVEHSVLAGAAPGVGDLLSGVTFGPPPTAADDLAALEARVTALEQHRHSYMAPDVGGFQRFTAMSTPKPNK